MNRFAKSLPPSAQFHVFKQRINSKRNVLGVVHRVTQDVKRHCDTLVARGYVPSFTKDELIEQWAKAVEQVLPQFRLIDNADNDVAMSIANVRIGAILGVYLQERMEKAAAYEDRLLLRHALMFEGGSHAAAAPRLASNSGDRAQWMPTRARSPEPF